MVEFNLQNQGVNEKGVLPLLKVTQLHVDVESIVNVRGIEDIIEARHQGRELARKLRFAMGHCTLLATVISELARNIVLYAKQGEIVIARVEKGGQEGVKVIASDDGPGIQNVQHALMSGYSSSGGLGLGLSGVQQIVDEFDIDSQPDKGTKVTIVMWQD